MFDDERLKPRIRKPRRPTMGAAGERIGQRVQDSARSTRVRLVEPRRRRDRTRIGLRRPRVKRQIVARESEAHFQARVVRLARALGWQYVYHTFDSRRSASGFPDLVMIHPRKGRLAFVELKSRLGKLTWAQTLWKVALEALPMVEYFCWKPADWDEIVEVLRRA